MFYNYEYAAAEVFGIPVEKIFEKTRKDGAPFVRHILMHYRMSVLKKSQLESARRYGLSRYTALGAGRKISFYLDKYPDIKAKYDEFVIRSDQNFFDSIQGKTLQIEKCLKEIIELAAVEKFDFNAHEKRMVKLAECDSELKELKKLISNRWNEI